MSRPAEAFRGMRRRWLLWAVLGLAVVAVVLTALSGFYIDILWFREVGLSSVFWTRFWTRVSLALAFGAIFFALIYSNLLVARAIRPRYRITGPEDEYIERYRQAFEPYAKWVLLGIAAAFSVFAAAGVAGRWQDYQLWRASGSVAFGVPDPVFGRDVAFHVLNLPFQKFVQGWLFTSLVTVTVVTAAAHYLWGGIRPRAIADRVTPQVKAHLSVLLGLAVLVKAWGYRLGQYELLTSSRGTVTGASYTDVNAQLPALRLLVVIAIVCTVLFLVNIRFRGWALPAVGIGLLALTSIVAGALYPAFIQRFRVAPQELQRELPYIEHNIEFTRRAFGLDAVEQKPFLAEPDVSREDVEAAAGTIENIRLWNPDVLKQVYLQLQRIRPYYEFVDVDVDRYEIDGRRRVVMISPREIAQDGIPGGGGTWQNRHLFYTHGYGAAAARVDQITPEGQPIFALSDIPLVGSIEIEEPRVYYAERTEVPFVVTNTGTPEFDFPQSSEGESEFARHAYEGSGGIELSGFLRRAAFAWRYRDVNLLISGLIEKDSRILIHREIRERVRKAAPFLRYDDDPYTAVVDGGLVWIWDAYTSTERYPYSERVSVESEGEGGLTGDVNYLRNAVKVVIDAYDGTMTFFVADEDDPIIQAWERVFPGMMTPLSEASDELREHFRYPEDLFTVQAHQFTQYHVTSPASFYNREDFWAVPTLAQGQDRSEEQVEPYYVLVPLPGETEDSFVLFSPFTPAARPNMISWLGAVSDPDDYGRMVNFVFPQGRNVAGPSQVAGFIAQDTDVAREVSLFDQRGSRVIYGNLLAIPLGDSFLYVQPLYLESEAAASAIPELKRVIVVRGTSVTMAETLPIALEQSFGLPTEPEVPPEGEEPTEPGEPTPEPTASPEVPTGTLEELIQQAIDHFTAAQTALAAQDLGRYQAEIAAAQAAVQEAQRLLEEGP